MSVRRRTNEDERTRDRWRVCAPALCQDPVTPSYIQQNSPSTNHHSCWSFVQQGRGNEISVWYWSTLVDGTCSPFRYGSIVVMYPLGWIGG